MPVKRLLSALSVLLIAIAATPAAAQLRVDINAGISKPMPIAVPTFTTPALATTVAGDTAALGRQVAEVVSNDLASSGLFKPINPSAFTTTVAYADVLAPRFANWRTVAAQALVTGFVQVNGDGSITVGCYLYDVFSEEILAREGFSTQPAFWRRAAHKCADAVYSRLTGESGYFDSRIVYVSETGRQTKRIKRLAIMDQDGANHRFLTNGQNLVLTPRFSPSQQTIAYMSFAQNRPRVYVYNIGTGRQTLVGNFPNMSFAPRFSPDGQSLVFSMAQGGNTDIYRMSVNGGTPQRLTSAPGIDTGPSYSPDGSKIVFESDRGGTQQLYVMNADGSDQRRISFGGGRYATPVWSPRGDLIAFTRMGGGGFRIGVMRTDGSGERLLTDSWGDEGPTWSPNGRVVMFFRSQRGGRADLWSVDLTGVNERRIPTPLDGSDPAWSPLLP
ncbi:Tol-Pal system beta propeller repeat protein TolB [Sphingosinicella sp.]|jgi:TolB protein|uniref:Tol-Pal system beta propeller repeat protein TolB n=1 Tax=Sphingosinicella sp. TaxID=1917971 RepID=UPI0017910F3C|nr:Tol-Pal system beta propeller repeat protein TolB [Sphingosinicella sp.]MBA4757645.1 Tol-Pal system protein TolB [Sphingosinicella sp.]MEA3540442.1 Tol-Pal system beta propeller repeat protein TolB [Pseudomonadota bacterium]